MDNKTNAELVEDLLLTIKELNSKIESLITKVNDQNKKFETRHKIFPKIVFGILIWAVFVGIYYHI